MSESSPLAPAAICILGMHRSGTSALMGLLHLLGVDPGQTLMDPGPDNPKGYWEHRRIFELHDEVLKAAGSHWDDFYPLPDGWEKQANLVPRRERLLEVLRSEFAGKALWGIKDPRVCRLLPLWHGLFDELGVRSRFILMVRHPDEVAASLGARDRFSYNRSLLLTLAHLLQAERHTRGRIRTLVTYDELISNWERAAERIGADLGIQWPNPPPSVVGQASEYLDVTLRHHVAAQMTTAEQAVAWRGADRHLARWALEAYGALGANDAARIDERALDRIGEEFSRALPPVSAWPPLWAMAAKHDQERGRPAVGEDSKPRAVAEDQAATVQERADRAEQRLAVFEVMHAECQEWVAPMKSCVAEAEERAAAAHNLAAEIQLKAAERVAAAESRAAALETRAIAAENRAAAMEERAIAAETRAAVAEGTLDQIHHSISWKVTSPLRSAGRLANRLSGKGSPG